MIPNLAQQLAGAQRCMAAFIAENKNGQRFKRKHAPRRIQPVSWGSANAKRLSDAMKVADEVEKLVAAGITAPLAIRRKAGITEGACKRALARLVELGRIRRSGQGQYTPDAGCKAVKEATCKR